MPHGTRINGTSYGITGGKCLVGGTGYSIKKGRTLIGGTGYDITFGTPLSSYAEGDIVYINENGSPVEFYVSKHDYESGLNGTGRTLLVRKEGYDMREWNSVYINTYEGSQIDTWLNQTYKGLFPEKILSLIGTTKFVCTVKNSGGGTSAIERSFFILSLQEIGYDSGGTYSREGSALPICDKLKIASSGGSPIDQWLRSRYLYNTTDATISTKLGSYSRYDVASFRYWSRPVFTIPSSVIVGDDGVIS